MVGVVGSNPIAPTTRRAAAGKRRHLVDAAYVRSATNMNTEGILSNCKSYRKAGEPEAPLNRRVSVQVVPVHA